MPPGPQSYLASWDNTQCIWLLWLELWKSAQEKTRGGWLHEHISESSATATCMSRCHECSWHWTPACGFGEISDTPGCWEGKVMLYLGYCHSWGSFILSAVHSYEYAHRLSLNHVLVLAIQLHSKEVTRLSLASEVFPLSQLMHFINNLEISCPCLCGKKGN